VIVNHMQPFSLKLSLHNGVLAPCNNHIRRRLSDMASMYADQEAVQELLQHDDPVLYEVYQYDVPEEPGQLLVGTSVIHPGKVGSEYVMTKGHYHAQRDTAEVYLGLLGRGHLMLQAPEGDFRSIPFERGTVGYIPPYWAHRMVNTGNEDLIFYVVYPANAGHDYEAIARRGFRFLLVDRGGVPTLIANPRYGQHV
jgi:glucose-6-phosphate isomerase